MTGPLLDIRELAVRYGQVVALAELSLEIRAGEVVAILGANGAGKSSLLKAIIGHARAAAGTMTFAGTSLAGLAPWARARLGIGYSPEGRRIFPAMTVRENLEVASRATAADIAARVAEVYALFPALRPHGSVRGWQLSGGQQQMLAIGRALMAQPRLLLLDEPSLGLAPAVAADLFARLRDIACSGSAVLFADQNVPGALAVANRAYVFRTGRLAAHGAATDLRASGAIADALLGG